MDSDQMLNILSAEDFSKYAAGDVAEALERVAGVNIVEGQFAVIRGLEDRYSSTLYNGAIVPSPDPDRQSVQLDLFPSEIVGSLNVTKTFSSESPSNSSGGAIDILTHSYPEDLEFTLKAGTGFNDNARDRFLNMEGRTDVGRAIHGIDPLLTGDELKALKERGFKLIGGNPVGRESPHRSSFFDSLKDVIESDFTGTLGFTKEYKNREFRFKGVLSEETDYRSAFGFKHKREPVPYVKTPDTLGPAIFDFGCLCIVQEIIPGEEVSSGGLAFGDLNLSDGIYDLTISEREKQTTGYAAFGFDLDDAGNHKIDASVLWTEKGQEAVELKEGGFLEGFDYVEAANRQLTGSLGNRPDNLFFRLATTRGSYIAREFRDDVSDGLGNGALVWDRFFQSTSFQRDRDLRVIQLNGDHRWDELPGFHFSWAINRAETTQDEAALGMKYFFEPCGYGIPCPDGVAVLPPPAEYPVAQEGLGYGLYGSRTNVILSANAIEEGSKFFRIDGDYELHFSEASTFVIAGGWWAERAMRSVDSVFLETPVVPKAESAAELASRACTAGAQSQNICLAENPQDLGAAIFQRELGFENGNFNGLRTTESEGTREIDAWHVRGKLTFWEKLDLQGGARFERIFIESLNNPFQFDADGNLLTRLSGVQTFPSRYLLFDRLDNAFGAREVAQVPVEGSVFNDQILGLEGITPGPCYGDDGSLGDVTCVDFITREELEPLVNGKIDEERVLPFAGFAIRPIEGLSLRGAWSQTVARPSFRELGFYVSLEPGSDDRIIGNPQLQLSDVESWDARAEYTWGVRGDLLAFSWFRKTIQRPIETIILRDAIDKESATSGLYRTFFNNPNTADLMGIEIEARKAFDFLTSWWNAPEWFKYLSVGGNYTMIDAEVARTEAELARSRTFFQILPEDEPSRLFDDLAPTRRLFGQPEWIANADITFDNPDWGTKVTFAWFAISDILNAAGTATIAPDGEVLSYTLDRYTDAYDEFRVIASQTFQLPEDFGEITLKFAAKNLTDSTRRILYDPGATRERIPERSLNVGRDYSVSLTYTRRF
jgi:outer membrane receptor protein involved in Fe transport